MKSVAQKKLKIFRRNAEFIFAIGFQTVFSGTIFAIDLSRTVFWGSNFCDFGPKSKKISSAIVYSATIYDHKNFCPKDKWTSYLEICLNKRKIPKFQ